MAGLSHPCPTPLPSQLWRASPSPQGHRRFPGPASVSVNNKYCNQNKIVRLARGRRELAFLHSWSLLLRKSLRLTYRENGLNTFAFFLISRTALLHSGCSWRARELQRGDFSCRKISSASPKSDENVNTIDTTPN